MVKKHRQYNNDFCSVTEVLGGLRKIGLEMWYKFNTIEFINRESSKGKISGTDTHTAIETYINTGELKVETQFPEEVTNALHSFVLFRKEHPEIILKGTERPMTSEIYKYNGTMDIDAMINNVPVIGDWKTSTAKAKDKPEIYPEYIIQVSAYRHLYSETCGILVNSAFIVALAKDKIAYNLRYIEKQELEDCFNEVFLPALRIYNYTKRKEK